jgi:hypothetical protein
MTERRPLRVATPDVLTTLSCSLPPSGADRRRIETATLFGNAVHCEWIEDGARLRFDASEQMARAVLDFVLVERECCAQLSYDIVAKPPHDHIALVLRGPAELRDAIHAWVGEER